MRALVRYATMSHNEIAETTGLRLLCDWGRHPKLDEHVEKSEKAAPNVAELDRGVRCHFFFQTATPQLTAVDVE